MMIQRQGELHKRPPLEVLERRCQKPDYRRVGNWMARRVARPLALRITWLVLPWGFSAHVVTVVAWVTALAAAVAFGFGGVAGWLAGAALLQVWYLLDHVDGQIARYHQKQSLDGAALDYLMHHTVNLLLPIGLGWGLAARHENRLWLLMGIALGIALLLRGLLHDARYKAFIQRLKRLQGQLTVIGGGGGRPAPMPAPSRGLFRQLVWACRKAGEIHVLMNTLALLALAQWLLSDDRQIIAAVYLAVLTPVSAALTVALIARGIHAAAAEQEFTAWYRTPDDHQLVFRDGWWRVEPLSAARADPNRPGPLDMPGVRE